MTDKDIYRLYGEAATYSDPASFASDASISLLDPDDSVQEVDMALFEELRILWHVANDPFKALLKRMGLTQSQCSRRFCVPLRTVQNWAGEINSAPAYLRLMMAEAVELLHIRG